MVTKSLESVPVVEERRKLRRFKFRGKIEIEWGSTTLSGTVRDICAEGMFIELTPQLWMGASFLARLLLTPAIPLHCTVRRVEPGQGVAVTFEIPEEGAKAQLGALLADLPNV
jgi:hypothetical protein